jgi:hypothetical protein
MDMLQKVRGQSTGDVEGKRISIDRDTKEMPEDFDTFMTHITFTKL